MTKDSVTRALKLIEECTDPKRLRQMAENARKMGELTVARAAELKLYEILPSAKPGTLEHDVWRSIHALEDTLTQEREKTTRLNRTRQKIKAENELETIKALIMKPKASEGFHMLLEREMSALTFEAVALRHAERFDQAVLTAARTRLAEAGVELA